jgi:hypothetical protein
MRRCGGKQMRRKLVVVSALEDSNAAARALAVVDTLAAGVDPNVGEGRLPNCVAPKTVGGFDNGRGFDGEPKRPPRLARGNNWADWADGARPQFPRPVGGERGTQGIAACIGEEPAATKSGGSPPRGGPVGGLACELAAQRRKAQQVGVPIRAKDTHGLSPRSSVTSVFPLHDRDGVVFVGAGGRFSVTWGLGGQCRAGPP